MKHIEIRKIFNFRTIITLVVLLFVVFCTPIVGTLNFSYARKELDVQRRLLTLWHIETFEGGSYSRSAFLQKKAIEYEKTHKGVLIYIDNLSYEQARNKLESGVCPDMVSFGYGAGNMFAGYSKEYVGRLNIREDILSSGKVGGKVLAVPYMIGGYVKISDGSGVCATSNSTMKAVIDSDTQVVEESSYQVYTDFVRGKYEAIIGTQRDLIRINNRMEKGTMQSCTFDYITGYTDLVQYLSITSNLQSKVSICNDFIEYMLSDKVQSSISNIGMYSVTSSKIYNTAPCADMEKALSSELIVPNAYSVDGE